MEKREMKEFSGENHTKFTISCPQYTTHNLLKTVSIKGSKYNLCKGHVFSNYLANFVNLQAACKNPLHSKSMDFFDNKI